ncbi:hypothetical protein [Aureimonas sp. Leaf324]|jgi:hypothetical protein|uniref:hypothetical protein n=1 Tax=Aureimonas sp. Leaf324 TaxID=1736336 RepID=UPI0006FB52CB|nr:hypothetical protein [Aureimonas sp. Leaf324]KQQ85707.1 hypothetical protein ASF65_03930 [Aureimonas sp. Leaf324]
MNVVDSGTLPDVRVELVGTRRWRVSPVSVRAKGWIADHLPDTSRIDRPIVETDVVRINRLAAMARSNGLRIEFNGPLAMMRL